MRRLALALLPLMLLSACGKPADDTGDDETEVEAGVTDLALMGKNVTCTMTRTDEHGTMAGTVYVAGDGRVAGDFTMSGTPLGTMTFHVIRADEYAYTWGVPSASKGIKVKIDEEKKSEDSDASTPDIDDKVSYRCKRWSVDDSKFVPPASVTFSDPKEMMKALMGTQCGACDNVPNEEGKASCRKALGC